VQSLAFVKLAAIEVNTNNGDLNQEKAVMLSRACQSIINGGHMDAFQFELYNGSQGYLANAAVNEVLANLAIEMSGARKGNYKVISPSGDVNLNQNYQSVYQSALNVSIVSQNESLLKELESLQTVLLTRSNQQISSKSASTAVPIAIQSVNSNFAKHNDSLGYHIASLQLSAANLKYHTQNGFTSFKETGKKDFSDQISNALLTSTGMNFRFEDSQTNLENHLKYISAYLKALKDLNNYIMTTCTYVQALDSRDTEGDPFAFANINRDNGGPVWGHIIPGMVIENGIRTKGRLAEIDHKIESKKKKTVSDVNLMALEVMVSQQQLIRSIKSLRKNFFE
jgi:aspartate ammonia-lyase